MRSSKTLSVIHTLDSSRFINAAQFREIPVTKKPKIHEKLNMMDQHETQVVNLPEIQESNTLESFPISQNGSVSEACSDLSEDQASSISSFESLEISDNIPRFFTVYNRNSDLWTILSEWVPRDFSGQDSQCEIWKLSALTREAREITWHLAEMEEIYREKGVLPKDIVDQNCQTLVSIPPKDVENEDQEIATEIEIVEVPTIETVVEKQNVQTQTEESVNWSFFEFLKAKISNCLESLNDCLQSLNESFVFFFDKDVKTLWFICDSVFFQSLDVVLHVVEKIYSWFF